MMTNQGSKMRTVRLACLATLALAGIPGAASAMDAAPGPGPAEAGAPGTIDAAVLARVPKALTALHGRRQSGSALKAATRAGYRSLSEITGGAYPAFTPGIGAVYAKRELLPNGPFLAFDHKGRQVSTIYKFSLDRMVEKAGLEARGTRMPAVDHVTGHFSGNHPGVDFPNYSFVFWHVPRKDEARVAK